MHMRLIIGAIVIVVALFSTLSAPAGAAAPDDDKRLNVIVLLVDDWGWTDAACLGSDLYETPNIDALAASGMRFTSAYAACTVCSPTRAAMMTGQYPGRTRVTDWITGHYRPGRPLEIPDWTQRLEHRHVTIAEALRDAGYRTAHIGKWHLTPRSNDPAVVSPYYPERHGFEINVAGNQWGAPGSYFWPYQRGRGDGLAQRVANFPEGGKKGNYLTDTLTDETVKIIRQWKDEPFFIYFPYYTVHTPIQGKPELVAKYKAKIDSGEGKLRHTNPGYAAMVEALDQSVGRIVQTLEEQDIADRTVIFLTGDNGGLDRVTRNVPLRAGKGSAYEGGVRVPGIVVWPDVTKPGSVSDEPIITVDYYPTILELTGAAGDAKHNADVDGVSLTTILKDPAASLDREAIYWHYPHYHPGGATPYGAIRAGDWRLVEFFTDNHVELYNLADDIGEKHDLAKKMPDKAAALRANLHAWRKAVDAQMPTRN